MIYMAERRGTEGIATDRVRSGWPYTDWEPRGVKALHQHGMHIAVEEDVTLAPERIEDLQQEIAVVMSILNTEPRV